MTMTYTVLDLKTNEILARELTAEEVKACFNLPRSEDELVLNHDQIEVVPDHVYDEIEAEIEAELETDDAEALEIWDEISARYNAFERLVEQFSVAALAA